MTIATDYTPRDDEEDEDFARAWIAFGQAERHSPAYNALFWAFDRMYDLVEDLPNKAWQVILLIWSMDQSIKTVQSLSAGPIEDLLSKHGDEMIALVEAEAKRDPSFAKLLGGVWKNRMTDEVWDRVQKVWDRCGWDGIPEE